MKWFLAAMMMLTLLTFMLGDQNVVANDRVETTISCRLTEWSVQVMDLTLLNSVGIYLLADADDNNGDENGEKKEKDLEADPTGGVDRIWNAVQLA